MLVIGLVWWSIRRALKSWRTYRRIVDTPTSTIGELKNGFFEVRGKVVAPADPLISLLSGTRCSLEESVCSPIGYANGCGVAPEMTRIAPRLRLLLTLRG